MLRESRFIKILVLFITIKFRLAVLNLIVWDYLGVHNSFVIISFFTKKIARKQNC